MATIINASTSGGLIETADTSGILLLQSGGVTQKTIDSTGAYGQLKQGTVQPTTSGIAITFSSIPSWAKRVTMQLQGVTPSASSSNFVLRIGSGSVVSTGYTASCTGGTATLASASSTVGFPISNQTYSSTGPISGQLVFTLLNASTNLWVCSGTVSNTSSNAMSVTNGYLALSGALDRVQIATANSTDTFTAGNINILYEG